MCKKHCWEIREGHCRLSVGSTSLLDTSNFDSLVEPIYWEKKKNQSENWMSISSIMARYIYRDLWSLMELNGALACLKNIFYQLFS